VSLVTRLISLVFVLSLAACGSDSLPSDTTPDAFTFSEINSASLNTLSTSNTITLAGFDVSTDISVEFGEYSIDDGPFTATAGTLEPGQSIAVRHTTSNQNTVINETTLNVGDISGVYRTITANYGGVLSIVGAGTDVVLMGMNASGMLEERGRASLTEQLTDYNTNHVIFSITKHPQKDMVFVTSSNECANGLSDTDACFGNARIDRFTYDANGITYDGLAYLAQGPLRFIDTAFDDEQSLLSTTLLNQGKDDVSIDSLVADNLTAGSTFTTTCDNVTLTSGQQCSLTIMAGDEGQTTGDISVTTSTTEFNANVLFNDGLNQYFFNGLVNESGLMNVPRCVNAGADYRDIPNSLGQCALTALTISADGTRAYAIDGAWGSILVFSINQNGEFDFLSSFNGSELHGVAINADNTILYSGNASFSVIADQLFLKDRNNSGGGNATEIIRDTSDRNLLISTIGNNQLAIYELDTNPLVPTELTSLAPASGNVRYQDHSDDLSTFAVIDHQKITTLSFDGMALNELSSLDIAITFETDLTCECSYDFKYRAVQVTNNGNFAIGSAFIDTDSVTALESAPFLGAATTFSIDPSSGQLIEVDRMTFAGKSRTVLMVAMGDYDKDGRLDVIDLDDDNDGTPDDLDAFPYDANESKDSDLDGVGDNADFRPFDASETADIDNDGIGDNEDIDDDNDNINDTLDVDADRDGLIDDAERASGTYILPIAANSVSSFHQIGLAQYGLNVGDTVTIESIRAQGDLGSSSESFELNFNDGELVSSELASSGSSDCSGSFDDLTAPVTAMLNVIDLGDDTPGISIMGITTEAVDDFCDLDASQSGVLFELILAVTAADHLTPPPNNDVDGDGVDNDKDLDSDNDGIADVIEAGLLDENGDFIADSSFSLASAQDTDNDGLADAYDLESNNPLNDGTAFDISDTAFASLDTNNDGMVNELDTNGGIDANNDGVDDLIL